MTGYYDVLLAFRISEFMASINLSIKIIARALQCFLMMLRLPSKGLMERMQGMVNILFVILADHTGLGIAGKKQATLELNQLIFKVFHLIQIRI